MLSIEGADPRLMLLPCADATPTSYLLEGSRVGYPATHWASLPPGSYAMFPGPLPTSVTLHSYLPGPLVGNACDSSNVVSLDTNGRTSVDLLPGHVNGWMRLAGGGHTYRVSLNDLVWNNMSIPGAVSICDDCSAASCVPLPYGQATQVVVSDQAAVRFQSVISFPSLPAAWGQLVFDTSPAN